MIGSDAPNGSPDARWLGPVDDRLPEPFCGRLSCSDDSTDAIRSVAGRADDPRPARGSGVAGGCHGGQCLGVGGELGAGACGAAVPAQALVSCVPVANGASRDVVCTLWPLVAAGKLVSGCRRCADRHSRGAKRAAVVLRRNRRHRQGIALWRAGLGDARVDRLSERDRIARCLKTKKAPEGALFP